MQSARPGSRQARETSSAGEPALGALLVLSALMMSCSEASRADGDGGRDAGLASEEAGAAAQRCQSYVPERLPFFGDLHVHTALSLDANLQGMRLRPRDAYRFARGQEVELPPYDAQGRGARRRQLDRPLDFVAVSDHAEFLGLVTTCLTPGSSGYDSVECVGYRTTPDAAFLLLNARLAATPGAAAHAAPCSPDNQFCGAAANSAWQETIEAAQQANDDSDSCTFTAFISYEWSGSPGTQNLHRNVIFRGDKVPALPFSYFEGGHPEQLWQSLNDSCRREQGCQALTIPHNSNLSAGLMFEPVKQDGSPFDADYASLRARMEPLAEIIQHKGSSECLPEMGPDEQCAFELMPYNTLGSATLGGSPNPLLARDQLRDALMEGLRYERSLGVNPFAYGFVGSTDTHMGTPGAVDEASFQGHGGAGSNARTGVVGLVDKVWFNPGGLAVLWAEENSREALFAAMQRREAYATSGPRVSLRFFAGPDLPDDVCQRADFVNTGYQRGVPMGGVLSDPRAPRLFVRAERDPGSEQGSGGLLERIQIIKGSLVDGQARYQVFDVAGQPGRASVDESTCTPRGPGHDALCASWVDPSFDARTPAFYYARVLENPSCRWHARACLAAGVRCQEAVPAGYEGCCAGYSNTHQERAWSSPIYFRPQR